MDNNTSNQQPEFAYLPTPPYEEDSWLLSSPRNDETAPLSPVHPDYEFPQTRSEPSLSKIKVEDLELSEKPSIVEPITLNSEPVDIISDSEIILENRKPENKQPTLEIFGFTLKNEPHFEELEEGEIPKPKKPKKCLPPLILKKRTFKQYLNESYEKGEKPKDFLNLVKPGTTPQLPIIVEDDLTEYSSQKRKPKTKKPKKENVEEIFSKMYKKKE